MQNTTVADLMKRAPAFTLSPDDGVMTAVRAFVRENVDSAPVVDDGDRVIGVVSAKDCLRASLAVGFHPGADDREVSEILSSSPEVLSTDDTMLHALEVFAIRPHRLYPVVGGDGRFAGVLRRQGLLDGYLKALQGWRREAVSQDRRERISSRPMRPIGPATNWWFLNGNA